MASEKAARRRYYGMAMSIGTLDMARDGQRARGRAESHRLCLSGRGACAIIVCAHRAASRLLARHNNVSACGRLHVKLLCDIGISMAHLCPATHALAHHLGHQSVRVARHLAAARDGEAGAGRRGVKVVAARPWQRKGRLP